MKRKKFIRGAGILMPVSSLPSPYGIGTAGYQAFKFVDFLSELKQRYWQVLPIGPTSYGDSPYQSFSAFAGNPYFIDLDLLVSEGLLESEEITQFSWGSEKGVDYGKIFENRFKVLEIAFQRFKSTKDNQFHIFCKENAEWLDDYAMYMAVKEYFNNAEWSSWAPEIRNRTQAGLEHYQVLCKDRIEFWKFVQYKFFEHWSALKKYANKQGVEIIGDIPLYVAYDSADVWAHRELFYLEKDGTPVDVSGCPPDAFSDLGQKWGNPLYDWDRMEKDNFQWWRKRMKQNMRIFDILRIDHFIGFVRYYAIPAEDPDGRNGEWRKGPGKKLTDAIEEATGHGRIIAEDLGVPVPGVRKLMEKTGWLGMKILIFAFDGNTGHEFLPHNYENRNWVVYAGTHDNETVVGYFKDKTEYELVYLYEYLNISSKEEIPDALLRLAYSSVADLVIFQMQDILKLGNEARINFPGTVGENWKWRFDPEMVTKERKEFIRTLATIYRR